MADPGLTGDSGMMGPGVKGVLASVTGTIVSSQVSQDGTKQVSQLNKWRCPRENSGALGDISPLLLRWSQNADKSARLLTYLSFARLRCYISAVLEKLMSCRLILGYKPSQTPKRADHDHSSLLYGFCIAKMLLMLLVSTFVAGALTLTIHVTLTGRSGPDLTASCDYDYINTIIMI